MGERDNSSGIDGLGLAFEVLREQREFWVETHHQYIDEHRTLAADYAQVEAEAIETAARALAQRAGVAVPDWAQEESCLSNTWKNVHAISD